MTKKSEAKTRPVLTFKTTYLSDVGIRTLGNHALALPKGHPARETIRLLIERWVRDGQPVDFGETEVDGDAFDGLEDVMQEAA